MSPATKRIQKFDRAFPFFVAISLLGLLGLLLWKTGKLNQLTGSSETHAGAKTNGTPSSYVELCACTPSQLADLDIALMNLLCAEGLRGAEDLNVTQSCALLDGIARHVKDETERHLYKYREHPEEFENSEGYYRMMMMVTVLQQDLGIHYNPERIQMPWEPAESEAKFFADSRDVFIHGLARDKGTGTCSSMPVFYVAIGRRLGYPLKLVKAKGHLFARWEGRDRTFNIEGTTTGFVSHPDDYYRTSPVPFTPEEEKSERYLKSLTPEQELAVFLSIRGLCLRAVGNSKLAYGAMSQAHYRDQESIGYQKLFARAEREAAGAGVLPRREALMAELRNLPLPEGPKRNYFVGLKALLQASLLSGRPDAEIEVELFALKAELMSGAGRFPPMPTQQPPLQNVTDGVGKAVK